MNPEKNSLIVPTFRYKNAKKAIHWLCDVFGFQQKAVYENEDGTIANAQLTLGNAMIMLASVRDNDFDQFIGHPQETGTNTMSLYIIVSDIKEHYKKAVDKGAEICLPLKMQDYGGGGYTCKDLEGYLWNFGSYDPWNS